MDYTAEFFTLTHEGLSILVYTGHFCPLAKRTHFDDETVKPLYWIGANYYSPLNFPDLRKGTWKEAFIRWLQCSYSQLMPSLKTTGEPEPHPPQRRSQS